MTQSASDRLSLPSEIATAEQICGCSGVVQSTMRISNVALALILCGSSLVGCGGSKGETPTSPTGPQTGAPAASTSVRVSAVSFQDRTAAITWAPVAAATGYDILLGTSRGARDLGVVSVEGTTTHTLRDIPLTPIVNPVAGNVARAHWVTVLARNGVGVSANGPSAGLLMGDMKGIVDALFFYRGEYVPGYRGAGSFEAVGRPVAHGWPRGTQVRLRVASTFSSAQKNAIRMAMDQLNDAFSGALRVSVEDHEADLGVMRFEKGSVFLVQVSPAEVLRICGGPTGCMVGPNVASEVASGVVIEGGTSPTNLYPPSHEAGHGVGGLGHVQIRPPDQRDDSFPWFHFALMGKAYEGYGNGVFGVFAPWELDAIRAVYSAGLGAGSPRSEFVARGLVNP